MAVFHHRLASVAEEMGETLRRTAHSANIKERLDYSCAVFGDSGNLLAQAAHIPVHLGALEASVHAARASRTGWAPGDIVILNDPYGGGSHLPDLTTVSAVHHEHGSEPVAFLATRAHHADIGGVEPGSMPLTRDLFGEGLVLPPVLLANSCGLAADVLGIILANTRVPLERRGDLDAQVAAHRRGEHRLRQVLDQSQGRFGIFSEALVDHASTLTQRSLDRLPHGSFDFEDALDGDGIGGGHLRIQVEVTMGPNGLTADFSGSAGQAAGSVNAPLAVTVSAVYYVVACLLPHVPLNSGVFRWIRVIAPLGSILNPQRPAPVAGGNVETSQRVVDVMLGALAKALPNRIPAASQGTMNNVLLGNDLTEQGTFSYYETLGGGAGAGPSGTGASAVQVHMTNTRNTPTEALEDQAPVRILVLRVRPASGGEGRYRGGDGLEREIELLAPTRVTLLGERREIAPWGLAGGKAGATGESALRRGGIEHSLASKGSFDAKRGDVLIVRTPGGGGWGDAMEPATATRK